MIKRIKEIFNNPWWKDFLYIIGCFVFVTVLLDGWYWLTKDNNEQQITPYVQTIKIPINYIYGVRYKDGTIENVCANSYIWDGGKVKFFVNDTIIVKTVDSSCIEDVFIKKEKK